ncbi:anthranilate phosphoribosyltransferase, partial [Methanosarcinales archaeon]
MMLEIWHGRRGFMRAIVLLNAAGGLYIGGQASDIKGGLEIAENVIDVGRGIG